MNHTPELFHPLVSQWFAGIGQPTDIQRKAWPEIAAGKHCLITAPTGSGKTLTAFLWALNQFITGNLETGRTRVLYVSPLKALNNDILHNLHEPLAALEALFESQDQPFPQIRVQTRSGDTDQVERRRMLLQPPEILITTPESLNLLLSSRSGISLLQELDTIILDEVHSILGSKRGAYLMSAVERLTLHSGEFQRLALSATVNPLETAASFVGGYQSFGDADAWQARPVEIIDSDQLKRYDIEICYPESIAGKAADKDLWAALAVELLATVRQHRSTLIFVNSRALCEKLTHKINVAASQTIAYAHHGALSKDIRVAVEQRFKAGELAAIVATSSLEMGIDIGELDQVLIVQTTGSMASAIQRIGRAGHRIGDISRGRLYPTHPQDFIESVVLARAIDRREIEPVKPVLCPLDVLAQVIISICAHEVWHLDEMYDHLRTSYTFHNLAHEQFTLVINMLAGRYADNRIRELKPRISLDRLDNTIQARKGAVIALYASGGVIPNRGYFQLRHAETSARIGELDEEFVWEARIGQTFTLGTQYWQVQKITHNDVLVLPGKPGPTPPPFWKAEDQNRNFHFSCRILDFLEQANAHLTDSDFKSQLENEDRMSSEAIQALLDYLVRQKEHTGADLPHRHHVLVEHIHSLLGHQQSNQVVVHTGWGSTLNRPWALALEAAWQEKYAAPLEIFASNDCLVLQCPDEVQSHELLSLVRPENIEQLLRQRLEGSGFFGARFRECAGRAMLISKGKFGQRQPLWMSRLQSQKLFENVSGYEDFPILLETWRTCLRDEFDLDALRDMLTELDAGQIRWTSVQTNTPSPMARNIAWDQVNQYMYMDDVPKAPRATNLRDDLLEGIVFDTTSRPGINVDVCKAFQEKSLRLAFGYAPETSQDLLEWLKERTVIPGKEWNELCRNISRQTGSLAEVLAGLQTRAVKLLVTETPDSRRELIVAIENLPDLMLAKQLSASEFELLPILSGFEGAPNLPSEAVNLPEDIEQSLPGLQSQKFNSAESDAALETLLSNFLQFYGPLKADELVQMLALNSNRLLQTLEDLVSDRTLIKGPLLEGVDDFFYCDRQNFERLLFLQRRADAPVIEPIPLKDLPVFLHAWQQTFTSEEPEDRLLDVIHRLQGLPLDVAMWENEIFPARINGYQPWHLDQLFQQTDILWLGMGSRKVAFCFDSDLDLLETAGASEETSADLMSLFADPQGRYDFNYFVDTAQWPAARVANTLWQQAWLGKISNDSFSALRKAQANKFEFSEPETNLAQPGRPRGRRHGGNRLSFSQWKQHSTSPGNWYLVPEQEVEEDSLETLERTKDRVRMLLDRYGILFREILLKEPEEFRWGRLLKALRLMELSRELVSGQFFQGIPGPQFISHKGLRALQQPPKDHWFWLNACDPLSLCGVPLAGLKGSLPARRDSIHMVYRGAELVLVSQRKGRDLQFNISAQDPEIQKSLMVFKHLLFRACNPLKQIVLETINEVPAAQSEYLDALRTGFDLYQDHRQVILQGRR